MWWSWDSDPALSLTPKCVLSLGFLTGNRKLEQKDLGHHRGAEFICLSMSAGPVLRILMRMLPTRKANPTRLAIVGALQPSTPPPTPSKQPYTMVGRCSARPEHQFWDQTTWVRLGTFPGCVTVTISVNLSEPQGPS